MTTSLQSMRTRVWRTLCCATDQEILDGMSFYPGANGLCRFLSGALSRPGMTITTSQIAGMYAALSPMNTWDTNVSNIIDVVRDGTAASVNTPDVNLHKAIQILHGTDPLAVLGGPKVRSFYQAINNPDDNSSVPVDRHLINCALGVFPGKSSQAQMAHDANLYSRVEQVYEELGRREGVGNRLASTVWFVQRRLSRHDQIAIPHPAMVCCGNVLRRHGTKTRRFICRVCGKTRTEQKRHRTAPSSVLYDFDLPITDTQLYLRNGRPQIYLGKSHQYANSGGVAWLARFVVMYRTGERLHKDEHVHHCNGNKLDCRSTNLKVMLSFDHGRLHARKQLLYMLRDRLGRWAQSDVPPYADQRTEQLDVA